MFCVIIYFNEARTDFLIYGPYRDHGSAETDYFRRIKPNFARVPVHFLVLKMMEGEQ